MSVPGASVPRESKEQPNTAAASDELVTAQDRPRRSLLERVGIMLGRIGLAALTVVLGLNLWTGFPLLASWVGSAQRSR